jgi:hypothetical protein
MKITDARIISDNVAHCNVPVSDAGMSNICFRTHEARCFPFLIVSTTNILMISPLQIAAHVPFSLIFTGNFSFANLNCICAQTVAAVTLNQNRTKL